MIYILQEVSLIGKVVHFWDTCAYLLLNLSCILPYPQIQPLGADSSRCVPSLQGLGIRFLLSDECRMGYFYTRIFWIGKIGASQVISGTHNLQGAILCNYYLMVIGASR